MNSAEDFQALSFIERLDARVVQLVKDIGRPLDFQVGQLLSRQGDPGGTVFLLASGVVKITALSQGGTEVILGFRAAGDLLGEHSALQGMRRSGNIIGHEAGSLLKISGGHFRRVAFEHPEILVAILGISGQRLRQSDLDRILFASYDVTHRVGAMLLDWARFYGEDSPHGIAIRLRISRKELAQAVAASEKTVDSVLTTLRTAGLVQTGRRRFVLPDPQRLRSWMSERAGES